MTKYRPKQFRLELFQQYFSGGQATRTAAQYVTRKTLMWACGTSKLLFRGRLSAGVWSATISWCYRGVSLRCGDRYHRIPFRVRRERSQGCFLRRTRIRLPEASAPFHGRWPRDRNRGRTTGEAQPLDRSRNPHYRYNTPGGVKRSEIAG